MEKHDPVTDLHHCRDPIFILGIMQRSGTNFLKDVVQLHPDCGFPGHPLVEDYLAQNTEWLLRYTGSVARDWNGLGRINKEDGSPVDYSPLQEELAHCLGNGIISFLQARIGDKRLLTKTPSVRNLKHFFEFFPNARLIIVVRDGRAVVESGVKSFGWQYERGFQEWADAARSIIDFDKKHQNSKDKYLIVRYEDVLQNLEIEIKKILVFLELEVTTYDLQTALNLPVRGSSTVRSESDQMLWKAVDKPNNFNPLERWKSWEPGLHKRFNWIAGDCMQELGYELKREHTNSFLSNVINNILDAKLAAIDKSKEIYTQIKQVFNPRSSL